jgi:hypothetical protein
LGAVCHKPFLDPGGFSPAENWAFKRIDLLQALEAPVTDGEARQVFRRANPACLLGLPALLLNHRCEFLRIFSRVVL